MECIPLSLNSPQVWSQTKEFVLDFPLVSLISSVALTAMGIDFFHYSVAATTIVGSLIGGFVGGTSLGAGLEIGCAIIKQIKVFKCLFQYDWNHETHFCRNRTQERARERLKGYTCGYYAGRNIFTCASAFFDKMRGCLFGIIEE